MSDSLAKMPCEKYSHDITTCSIIIKVIEQSEDHPDVDLLYRRSVELDNTISIATVYRTMKLLEAGVVERLEFGDGRARYEESGDHHEHLVDVETGEVIEFFDAELEEMKRAIAEKWDMILLITALSFSAEKSANLCIRPKACQKLLNS